MNSISTKELCELIKTSPKGENVFVDVRPKETYKEYSLEGTRNIPFAELEGRAEELRHYRTIYVNCKMGQTSQKACKLLSELGFKNVVNVEGGLDALQNCK